MAIASNIQWLSIKGKLKGKNLLEEHKEGMAKN